MKVSKKNAIKCYKAFNKDWTCKDFKYEVGKTYHYKGKISICKHGFHACEKPSDCFTYYPFDPKQIKFAEVLLWGNVERNNDDSKLCASNIEISREISWEEILIICNSGCYNSGHSNSGDCNSGNCNSGCYNSGNSNSGHSNSGDRNSGHKNSGRWNSGKWNSGSYNSGNWNSGDRNSGSYNSGNWNSGSNNSGNLNYGSYNSGNWNSGSYNSGSYNSGNWNSGYFNTEKQNQMFCFNKLVSKDCNIDFPKFLFFELTKWICVSTMTTEEKENHPECDVLGGYLKTLPYKDAFRASFLEAKKKDNWKEELSKLKAIPNFDYEIFEEISGITKEELEN